MPSPTSAEPYFKNRWNFEREIPAVPENLVHEMRKKQLGQLKWLEFTRGFRPTRVFAPYFRKPLEFRSQISGGILGQHLYGSHQSFAHHCCRCTCILIHHDGKLHDVRRAVIGLRYGGK
jgi:hypothetical protein